ncbi:MAG: molybdopterin dinucleotide binding domain-containing protein [Candidatus Methanomethylicia archaeon]
MSSHVSRQFKLVITRTHNSELMSKMGSLNSEYANSVAIVSISKSSMVEMGIKNGDNVEVSSLFNSVVVRVKADESLEDDVAVMPMSPWSMSLLPPFMGQEGFPIYGRVMVSIKPTSKTTTKLQELLSSD